MRSESKDKDCTKPNCLLKCKSDFFWSLGYGLSVWTDINLETELSKIVSLPQ